MAGIPLVAPIRDMWDRLPETVGVHPRFSVVIPVRNRADVVGRAVAGVLAQTFGDLEVVVADDDSTDESVAAARAVADHRVHVIRQSHAGVAGARSSGVARSRGRWIVLLDPDDEVEPGWLARLGRLVDSTGAQMVSCGGEQRHSDGSSTIVAPGVVHTPDDGRPQFACFRPGAFAVPRQLLVAVGSFGGPGDERSLSRVGEQLVAELAATRQHAVATPEVLVRWNEPPAEPIPHGDELRLHWALQSLDALARTPIPDAQMLVRSATVGGIAAVRLGDHREARRLLRLARQVQPEVPRHWARWAVSCIAPLSTQLWNSDPGPETGASDRPSGRGAAPRRTVDPDLKVTVLR